jgi:integrase
MPRRHPQPFWREFMQCWYVQIGKKQVKLSADRDEAFRLYYELMGRKPEEKPPPPTSQPVVELLDSFLDWCQKNKAPTTYKWYRHHLQLLTSALPPDLPVSELKPYHLSKVITQNPEWSNNSKYDFVSACQRAFNWALDEELIERSPVARMKKPAREARELAVSPVEYAQVMASVTEPNFRDLIELSWETGARVQELRKIEARYVQESRVVFPPKESKGKKYSRVIYLTERGKEIIRRLCEANPTGPILLNSEGRPWTKDAMNCAFTRLQKKIGKKYHLGAFRKGFATEALKSGVDTVTLAHLMGHRDPSMVSRVYGHVQQDPEHMASAARKAKGQSS